MSEVDYLSYVDGRDRALAADPQLPTWDKPTLGVVAKPLFPKCEKLMHNYTSGVDAEKKPALRTSCQANVEGRLNSVFNTYWPDFQKRGSDASGIAWFARKDLEAARWMMYQGDAGWHGSGGGCAANDQYKKAFLPLKDLFAKAEAVVQKIETGRGVRFDHVQFKKPATNSIIFIDVKTGKPVAKADHY